MVPSPLKQEVNTRKKFLEFYSMFYGNCRVEKKLFRINLKLPVKIKYPKIDAKYIHLEKKL